MTEDNRIPEIRAVLDEAARDHAYPGGLPIDELPAPATYFDRIQAILDSAPPAPRVFFFGDTVPGDSAVIDRFGQVHCHPEPWEIDNEFCRGYVEIGPVPYREEWLAEIDRASEERAIPEPTEGQNRGE